MKTLINYELYNKFPYLYNPGDLIGKSLKFYEGNSEEVLLISFSEDEKSPPNILLPYVSTARDLGYIESVAFENFVIRERNKLIEQKIIQRESKLFLVDYAKGVFVFDVDGDVALTWFLTIPPMNSLPKLCFDEKTRKLYRMFDSNHISSVAMASTLSKNLIGGNNGVLKTQFGAFVAMELLIAELGHEFPSDRASLAGGVSVALMTPGYRDVEYGPENLEKLYLIFNKDEV